MLPMLLLASLVLVPQGADALAGSASLSAGSGSGLPGASGVAVSISLNSQTGPGVVGVNFDVGYDTSRLTVDGVSIGSAASAAGKSLSWSEPTSGTLRIIVFGLNQNAIADGAIAVISFSVRSTASPGTFALPLSNAVAVDPDGGSVALTLNPGSFTVLAPPPTDTPVPSPTNTPIPTDTPIPSDTPVPSATPTATIGPPPTVTRTPTTGPSPTASNTFAPLPSPTASITPDGSPTATPSATKAAHETPTGSPPPTESADHPLGGGSPKVPNLPLEAAVASTATALAQFEESIAATATALAVDASGSSKAAGGDAPIPETDGGARLPLPSWALFAALGASTLGLAGLFTRRLLRKRGSPRS